jgi:hypothetical protein
VIALFTHPVLCSALRQTEIFKSMAKKKEEIKNTETRSCVAVVGGNLKSGERYEAGQELVVDKAELEQLLILDAVVIKEKS